MHKALFFAVLDFVQRWHRERVKAAVALRNKAVRAMIWDRLLATIKIFHAWWWVSYQGLVQLARDVAIEDVELASDIVAIDISTRTAQLSLDDDIWWIDRSML